MGMIVVETPFSEHTTAIMDTSKQPTISSSRRSHQRHPLDFKRSIVEQSYQPGVSVSALARANGINANQVFAWRKLFREANSLPVSEPVPALIPVTIEANEEPTAPAAPLESLAPLSATTPHASPPAVLKLEFQHCCVTIEGCPGVVAHFCKK